MVDRPAITLRGVGVMTGTSLDGIDLVCCEFTVAEDGYRFAIEAAETVALDEVWRNRIRHLPTQSAEVFAKTNIYLGHYLGEAIATFLQGLSKAPDFVASHGQTIFHQPHKSFTVQIGDGETIASYLPCPLLSNFRNKDVALGGEGAPLVPLGERYLFPSHELFLNLGGICNLTWKDQAFDITACNLILNHVYRQAFGGEYDPEGMVAAGGCYLPELAEALRGLAYYQVPPPKSLGWEWMEQSMIPLLEQVQATPPDLLHTLCRHIAEQIAAEIAPLGTEPQSIMVTGGGRRHGFLLRCIEEALAPLGLQLDQHIDQQWIEFKEAIIFAFLGLRVLEGKSSTLASVTGARHDVVAGSIHLPPTGGWKLVKN